MPRCGFTESATIKRGDLLLLEFAVLKRHRIIEDRYRASALREIDFACSDEIDRAGASAGAVRSETDCPRPCL